MSDTVEAAIDHARASADALDSPEDIEDRALRGWVKKHVSFSHGAHHYIVGTDALPIRWWTVARHFDFPQDALAFLRPLKRDHKAMDGMRQTLFRINGGGFCSTDEVVLNGLADAFVNRSAWLLETRTKPPPQAGRTDPDVYVKLNGQFGTAVDFKYLSRWEGGQYLRGYVPLIKGVVAGKSGMTIATGFDIGQISEDELSKLDLLPETGPKLAPYTSLQMTKKTRAEVLAIVAKRGPVPEISKSEADQIDRVVHGKHLSAAASSWNAARKTGVPVFKDLPAAWQTVLFSRTFHQGIDMPNRPVSKTFYTAATAGKWDEAATALQNYDVSQGWYKTRVAQEAALLRTQMPPKVLPP